MSSPVIWLVIILSYVPANIFAGLFERQMLGIYSNEALLAPFFSSYYQSAAGNGWQTVFLAVTSIPTMIGNMFQMVLWNFAIFETGTRIAYIAHIGLYIYSAAFIIALFFYLSSLARGTSG